MLRVVGLQFRSHATPTTTCHSTPWPALRSSRYSAILIAGCPASCPRGAGTLLSQIFLSNVRQQSYIVCWSWQHSLSYFCIPSPSFRSWPSSRISPTTYLVPKSRAIPLTPQGVHLLQHLDLGCVGRCTPPPLSSRVVDLPAIRTTDHAVSHGLKD